MCAARFMPASLPRASNVAKAGSRPVRTLLYVRDLPVAAELSWCVKVQNAFTFPENEKDRKSTRLNSSHGYISYAVFCLKKKKIKKTERNYTYHTRNDY